MSPFQAIVAVLFTVVCTSSAQIILKFRLNSINQFPFSSSEWPAFFLKVITDFGILLAFGLALLGALCYIAAISRISITYLYPLASLTFPLVLVSGWMILGETLTWQKVLGSALIILGVAISANSA